MPCCRAVAATCRGARKLSSTILRYQTALALQTCVGVDLEMDDGVAQLPRLGRRQKFRGVLDGYAETAESSRISAEIR